LMEYRLATRWLAKAVDIRDVVVDGCCWKRVGDG